MQSSESAANPGVKNSLLLSSFGWPQRLTLLLLTVAGVAIRLLYLDRKPFWFDECFSAVVARISLGDFLHLLWWREANMSLYYALLRVWLHFGTSEFYIRSLSVIFAAATIPAIYWLVALLYDHRVASIAAALFTFNAYSVRYSQEARSYALFVLLATLSSALLVAWQREPTPRHRASYILVSVLAVYAHFYALLLLAAHWLTLRLLGGPRTGDTDESAAGALASWRRTWITLGLVVLPLLVFVAKTGAGPIRWITRPGLHDLLEFFEHLAGANTWLLPAIYVAACIAGAAPLRGRLFRHDQNWETWRIQFLLIWLFFPVGLTVLLSFARPVFLARYMIFCLPALLILVSTGLVRIRPAWLLVLALTCVSLLALEGVGFVYGHDFDNERDASVAAAGFVLDHSQAGDAIIFHIAETRIPYEFVRSLRAGRNTASPDFTAQLGPEILFPDHGPGLDYRDFTGKPAPDFVHTAVHSHPRVWVMLMNNGPAGNPDPTTVMLTKILTQSFPKMLSWQFAKVEVRLYSQ